ncbi:J domain-containing protein [Clostridium paraputrificum]|uniref:J domain-containing protein n=1 Tax=Clostridium TaxID=1485 RepID=UPI003D34B44E
MDPYKVLGVFPHSSPNDIKSAYTHVVETYSSDDLQDDSTKTFYNEKLNEANEAYRIITHNMTCEEVRDLIECDDFIAAEAKLNLVSDLSSAEWNYLKGVLLLKKGWIDSGVTHIKQAATLNPYNNEYVATMNQLSQKVSAYKTNYNNTTPKQGGGLLGGLCNNNNSGGGNGGGGKGGLC